MVPGFLEPGTLLSKGRAGEDGYPSSRRDRENSHFLYLFVLSGLSMDRTMLVHIGEGDLSYLVCRFKCTHLDIPRNSVLPVIGASLSPGKLRHKIDHHKTIFCEMCISDVKLCFIFREVRHLFLYFLSSACQVLSLLRDNKINHFWLWLML